MFLQPTFPRRRPPQTPRRVCSYKLSGGVISKIWKFKIWNELFLEISVRFQCLEVWSLILTTPTSPMLYSHTYSKSMDQPGKVANPARGTGKMNISLSAFAPENLVSRDGFGSPVPRQPAHLHTQAESGAYFRDSSRLPRRRPFIYLAPTYAIGSVPSLSGHTIAYRWHSLPRVHRHRASKRQGSSERVLPWQVTMDQLICVSLSHTHY